MNGKSLSIDDLIRKVKSHPEIDKAGMILCHNGIVRAWDREGRKKVRSITVRADHAKIEEIREWAESQPGIVCVVIEPLEGEFKVGDDLLYAVVAGDIRENVFRVMQETVDRVKSHGVFKTEAYAD
jgi:molybdopterin synthase catalytic subunit